VASEVEAPCLVNMGAGGRLEELDAGGIGRLGLRIAIYPGLERAAAGYAIREALAALRKDGNVRSLAGRMLNIKEYNEVLKLDEVEEWEKRYLR
jgi:2-methylisocitrate lyase-like PEP mutase family enzyme